MLNTSNIYQQQIDLVNRIQPVYSSGLAQILQKALDSINIQMLPAQVAQKNYSDLQERMEALVSPFVKLQPTINPSFVSTLEPVITQYQQMASFLNNVAVPIVSVYSKKVSAEEETEINQINEKVISEILQPDQEKVIDVDESPIITLSPVNDRVLKYLSENPEALYQLSGTDFEIVMAEIYAKLGYDITRTQLTRDGGKDLIIRKPETLGDFIYYVECKKYAPDRHVGVGIVRSFAGTITTDRVNGGVIATTSFFTKDACKFINDNKWDCQIKMHDYNMVRNLLSKVV